MSEVPERYTGEVPPILPQMSPPTDGARGGPALTQGRCHMCGYSLIGLPQAGRCPECGESYTPESAERLKPWPHPLEICLRLGWPLIALLFIVMIGSNTRSDAAGVPLILVGWAMMVAVPANSYFQVRWMLKRSLPETKRTTGGIAMLRALGTTLCVLVFLALLVPFIMLGACLVGLIK